MNVAALIAATIGSFLSTLVLTGLMRRYAIATDMVDRPNPRSSHTGAVPRGGGLSIVAAMLVTLVIAIVLSDSADRATYWALTGTVVLLGGVGWADDRRGLGPLSRLAVETLTAVGVIWAVGAMRVWELGGITVDFGRLAPLATVLWFVWLTNVFNFMDGIDGIASSQSAIAAATAGVWFTLHGDPVMAIFCYVIMAASMGFLVWNWAPARIFMGDVGSVTLGGVFAALGIIGNVKHGIPIGAFALLLGVFLTDTTFTLLRRLRRGEAVWQAHRKHYYQRAVAAGWSHAQVTLGSMVASIVLAILATMEALRWAPRFIGLGLALAILIALILAVRRKERGHAM